MRAPHTLQGGVLLTKAINADDCPAKAAVPHRKAAASMPVCDAPPILPISNSAAMPAARTCLKPAWRQHNWGGTGSAKNTGHLILPRPCLGTWPASVGDSVFSGFSSGSEFTPEGMARPARCMRLPPYALHRDVRYGRFHGDATSMQHRHLQKYRPDRTEKCRRESICTQPPVTHGWITAPSRTHQS